MKDSVHLKRLLRRKKYVNDIHLQGSIILYFVGISIFSTVILYFALTKTMSAIDLELIRLNPNDAAHITSAGQVKQRFLRDFFIYYSLITFTLSCLGGVFLSHRIAGPIFRLKAALNQIFAGEEPALDLRQNDFLKDVFAVLKQLTFKKNENKKGFSLIELLIALAIGGLLITLASTEYQHFVAKARQGEAKANLGSLYAAEKTFHGETGSYTACLRQAGFVPPGLGYYGIGFNADPTTNPSFVTNNCNGFSCLYYNFTGAGLSCNCPGTPPFGAPLTYCDIAYGMGLSAQTIPPYPNGIEIALTSSSISTNQFTATAAGVITSGIMDVWTIDQNANLLNILNGS